MVLQWTLACVLADAIALPLPLIALPDDMVFPADIVFDAIMPPDIWPFAVVVLVAFGQPVSALLLLLIILFELMVLELMLLDEDMLFEDDIAPPPVAANTAPEIIRPAARAPAARVKDRKFMGLSLILGEPACRAA